MGKLHLPAVVMLFTMLFIALQGTVSAAGAIEVESKIGIDGKAQTGKGFPVEITLTNNGESVNGDLVVSSSKGYSSGHNQVIPVELEAGEEKTLELSMAGFGEHIQHSLNPASNSKAEHIAFYEGDFKSGDKVKLTGDLDLTPSFLPYDRLVIGVLSDNQDAFNAIKLAKVNGSSPELIQLTSVYDSAEALEVFDMLLINEFNVAGFSDAEQEAIAEWVKRGGELVIGSSTGVEQRLGSLASLMPLKPSGKEGVNQFELVSQKEPLNVSNFEIVTGELSETARVVFEQEDTPLVITSRIGMGEVTQLAYNPAAKALVDWEDNDVLWEKLIQVNSNKGAFGFESFDEMLSQLTYDSELFPGSIISVSLLTVLFAVYLLVVVPVLYLILNKRDKREWGWWIIPTLAILTSIGIYVAGAKDRLQGSQANEVTIFQVNESGMASGFGAASILTNGSGDYSVSFQGEDLSVSPKIDFNEDINYRQLPMLENTAEGERVTFHNVEYWSTRSAMIKVPEVEMGTMTADLAVKNNQLSGTLSSGLDVDLENVYLLSGGSAYSFGSLQAGKKMDVFIDEIQNSVMGAPSSYAAQKAFPNAQNYSSSQNEDWKEFALLEFLLMNQLLDQTESMPVIIGYSDRSVIQTEINNKVPKRNSLNLVVQPVSVTASKEGTFTLSGDDLIPDIEAFEGGAPVYMDPVHNGEHWVDISTGVYEFVYELPEAIRESDVNYRELSIQFDSVNSGSEIHLMKQGKKETLLDQQSQTFTDNLNSYITDNGEIVIQVDQTSNFDSQFFIPRISLKGEFTGD
ncbi:hypothetical protein ABFG93_07920 [Pseudalkalibacillus hwajinpoensis]|uniref:hypothetical protein n=1 Tax=Guptibacillus hwajinpoensis TaxID=208199 RepID=UPI00325BDC37